MLEFDECDVESCKNCARLIDRGRYDTRNAEALQTSSFWLNPNQISCVYTGQQVREVGGSCSNR
jgi:hypothetical protein